MHVAYIIHVVEIYDMYCVRARIGPIWTLDANEGRARNRVLSYRYRDRYLSADVPCHLEAGVWGKRCRVLGWVGGCAVYKGKLEPVEEGAERGGRRSTTIGRLVKEVIW